MADNIQPFNFFVRGWIAIIAAFVLGYVFHLSLAPYNIWPLGIICASSLAVLLHGCSPKQALFRAFIFGLGLFLGGTSWVYVSIHVFGGTPAPLAIVMTLAFCGFLGFVFSLPFYFYSRYLSKTAFGFTLGFAATWVLGEWLRTWLLTGFPWLFLGYAHVNTFLNGWAPIVGVLGIGFIAIASSNMVIASLLKQNKKHVIYAVSAIILSYGFGFGLSHTQWTTQTDAPLKTALVQPNIPLYKKWDPKYFLEIEETLHRQMREHWNVDLMVLPENSIPYLYNDAKHVLQFIDNRGNTTDTNIVAGILTDKLNENLSYSYYNSVVGEGKAKGVYHKQRLVPFGEYVPLESWIRGIINFFNLPTSYIQVGPPNPKGLSANTSAHGIFKISPFICYEIVYPDLVAKYARDAQLLITISNDAWFGDSIGPIQHYQMAQMRALENQKYLIRGTNTGLSGFINPKGESYIEGSQFIEETILGDVKLSKGTTPYSRFGSLPLILVLVALIGIIGFRQKHIS